jgi:4-hydroxy-L-threonine phosphate dehydrogenase PdxA
MKIGITMGDPKGVGPEIAVKAWKTVQLSKRRPKWPTSSWISDI